MSNNGAWFGDHSEQLEEMYQTIVVSEKRAGKEMTIKDKINTRQDIADAYDELIKCFDKEGADSTIITYAVNLMKETVSNSNDLRNISQLAMSISESTIGALYMVDHLQRRRDEKLRNGLDVNEFEVEEEPENKEEKRIEELTAEIKDSISEETIEQMCTDRNESEYAQLRDMALNGNKDAIVAVGVYNRATMYLANNPNGIGRDAGALSLISQLLAVEKNFNELSLTQMYIDQLVDVFELERFDIFSESENGGTAIDSEKLKEALKKEVERIKVPAKPENIIGTDYIAGNLERYKKAFTIKDTLSDTCYYANSRAKDAQYRKIYAQLEDEPEARQEFVANNYTIAKKDLQQRIQYINKYGGQINDVREYYNDILRRQQEIQLIGNPKQDIPLIQEEYKILTSEGKTNDLLNYYTGITNKDIFNNQGNTDTDGRTTPDEDDEAR